MNFVTHKTGRKPRDARRWAATRRHHSAAALLRNERPNMVPERPEKAINVSQEFFTAKFVDELRRLMWV